MKTHLHPNIAPINTQPVTATAGASSRRSCSPIWATKCLASLLLLALSSASLFAQDSALKTVVEGGPYASSWVNPPYTNRTQNATSGTLSDGAAPPSSYNGGVFSRSRPGYLFTTATAWNHYDPAHVMPRTWRGFSGSARAECSDSLTITGRHQPLTSHVTVRTCWNVKAHTSYEDPDFGPGPGEHWGGSGAADWYISVYSQNSTQSVTGRRGPDGERYSIGTNIGELITVDTVMHPAAPFRFLAYANCTAIVMHQPEVPGGSGEAAGTVSIELMSMAVYDQTGTTLLPVNVTAASGHVYAVAQPPAPGLPPTALHLTSHSISQDSGAVMLSFASEAGASYRVLGSLDLGRTQPWQPLHTLTGSAGVSIATFTDPAATTDASRFYKVERLAP